MNNELKAERMRFMFVARLSPKDTVCGVRIGTCSLIWSILSICLMIIAILLKYLVNTRDDPVGYIVYGVVYGLELLNYVFLLIGIIRKSFGICYWSTFFLEISQWCNTIYSVFILVDYLVNINRYKQEGVTSLVFLGAYANWMCLYFISLYILCIYYYYTKSLGLGKGAILNEGAEMGNTSRQNLGLSFNSKV